MIRTISIAILAATLSACGPLDSLENAMTGKPDQPSPSQAYSLAAQPSPVALAQPVAAVTAPQATQVAQTTQAPPMVLCVETWRVNKCDGNTPIHWFTGENL